jgi:hypothetical protein
MSDFNIHKWITITRSTNEKESPEERKGSIYTKSLIDLHNILQIRQGGRNRQGELPFAIDVKGGEKEKNRKDRESA